MSLFASKSSYSLSAEEQVIAREILNRVKKSKRILLHLHPRPDGDSLGSSLAMKVVLESFGKEVTLIKGDSELPGYLSHLPGFSTIVLKNIFEIDLASFDLFIIQDSGSLTMVSGLGPITFPPTLDTIVIDHHATNDSFGKVNLIAEGYPSVSELLYYVFKEWGVKPFHDMALPLFIGMYTDTGGFKYEKTTSRTFNAVSVLTEVAPDFVKALWVMDNNRSKNELLFEALALSLVQSYEHDHVALSAVSLEDLKHRGIETYASGVSSVANKLKSVVGWEIGAAMVEEEPGVVKVSFRTRDSVKFDVSKVAEALGGGGHKAAAAAVIKAPLSEAVAKVTDAIHMIYFNDGNL